MSFFGSLFGGSSPELNTLIGQYGSIGGQQTGTGQKNQNQAGDFFSSILSGDSSKTSQALAPAIDAAKKSTSQDQKTASMFGTRSGGTAASSAASADKTHGYIADLIGNLTSSSASNLASLGTSQVSTGLGALGQEQGAVAERIQNWNASILGHGITGAVQGAEALGMGAAGGMLPGGPGAAAGAQGAFASFLNG